MRHAFGKPGVLSQEALKAVQVCCILLIVVVWKVNMQVAAVVIVKIDGQVVLLSLFDHAGETRFHSIFFRSKRRICRAIPLAVEICTHGVESCSAMRHTVFIGHGHDVHAVPFQIAGAVFFKEASDQALRHPVSTGFP